MNTNTIIPCRRFSKKELAIAKRETVSVWKGVKQIDVLKQYCFFFLIVFPINDPAIKLFKQLLFSIKMIFFVNDIKTPCPIPRGEEVRRDRSN